MAAETFFRRREDGAELFVRLTPKSAKEGLEGVEGTADGKFHLRARVRAVPEKGKANQALVKLVSKRLGVPAGAISIVSGDTARTKTLRIVGDPTEIETRLKMLGQSGRSG
ncbi:DUF167 family protein [Aquamicrobium sp. LC103]|uniref:DUF167 family protein n=1 Tax=Aquamicrobium sp. LC103 TaxID=1120658 RepID=UPI00063E7195|nr:DUF167 family protein [Aquamicrobium sp. LC103]TKT82938.1 DUF167 domain-containing protein [Aquamicrobium sp. LC103]